MAEAKPDDSGKAEHTTGTLSTSLPAPTEEQRHLSQQAADDFEKGNYDACITSLNKLASSRSRDPKVAHNKVVVEFYRRGMTKVEEFRNILVEICAKAKISLDSLTGLDDVDQSVIYYNHAVLSYHLKQHKTAAAIVNKLFQFIEPMDDVLGRKFTFLLVDLYLCTYQPDKALGMISFIEKSLFGNGKSQQSPDKEKEGSSGSSSGGKESKDSGQDSTINEAWRPKISQYKARCYVMLKSLKSCKREVKALMNSVGTNVPVVYLKSNFEFLRGNYRKAIKVLNSAPPSTRPVKGVAECIPVMYYNNMAVIHFYMRKHNLGAFYLRKALDENNLAIKCDGQSGHTIHTLTVSRHNELLYNMGIQQLHLGKPQAAFDCLIETVQAYQVNPRLWLRLAECCIMAHKRSNDDDRKLENRLSVIKGSVGSGVHRKLMLGSGLLTESTSVGSAATPVTTMEFASLCLKNSLNLLPEDPVTASPPPPSSEDTADGRPQAESVLVASPPANPMKAGDVASLRCSILAAGAYVSLCVSDHFTALQYAEQLLKQPKLSPAHRYVGHMYLAEALVALDHIADAVQHLNPDAINDVSTTLPEQKQDLEKGEKNGDKDSQDMPETKVGDLYPWTPRELPRAKAIMKYNLATAHAIRGEYEKALMHLGQITQNIGMPLPAQMYFLKIYLELMEGRRKSAQMVIKEHFGHVTFNRN